MDTFKKNNIYNLLNNLLMLLNEEKDVLINEDGDKLSEIVEQKKELLDRIENTIVSELATDNKEDIKGLVGHIHNLQETNLILTRQTLGYYDMIINQFKKHSKSNKLTYQKSGNLDDKFVSASLINESV